MSLILHTGIRSQDAWLVSGNATACFSICNTSKTNANLPLGSILFHPLSKDAAVFLGMTCFYLPKLGL